MHYYFYLVISQPNVSCTTGSVRLNSGGNRTYISSGQRIEETYGVLEICVNGQYRLVCGHSNASLDVSDVVSASCNQLGYYSKWYKLTHKRFLFNFTLSCIGQSSYDTTYYISNYGTIDFIVCPYSGAPLSSCAFATAIDGPCTLSGNAVNATCRRCKWRIMLQ